jgi:hypothetical protein
MSNRFDAAIKAGKEASANHTAREVNAWKQGSGSWFLAAFALIAAGIVLFLLGVPEAISGAASVLGVVAIMVALYKHADKGGHTPTIS